MRYSKKIKKIKKRDEVLENETWDLTDLFINFDDWENKIRFLPKENEIEDDINNKYKNKLSQSPQILLECFQYREKLSRNLDKFYIYAALRSTEDTTDTVATEAAGKIENITAKLMSKFAFMDPEILSIPNIEVWIKNEPLLSYQFNINKLIRSKNHVLSEKEEEILTRLSVPLKTFGEIHGKWTDADLKFFPAIDSYGVSHIVSNSRYKLNLKSLDRVLRKNTFDSYYSEISKCRNSITSNYYGNLLSGSNLAKIRNFSGFLESELFDDNIPLALYDGLISEVKKNLHLLHRSMQLRKKILNIGTIFPYDRSVPLFESKQSNYFTWEEGRDLVLKAVSPLGIEYVDIASRGLNEERWIDRAENEGKTSGAFSAGTYDSRPYMLQTWNGTLSDVYTLAHELGHSMHTYYSNKNQPYHNAQYTIFVAEVASTLNESLLSNYIVNQMKDSDLAKSVLSENIENFEATVLRQTLFTAFEREASKIVDKDEAFTPEKLENIYLNLNSEWYGKDYIYPENLKYEWMRIPHFYSAFYVYKYATSYCASLALVEAFSVNECDAREQVFKILKAGASKSPLEILKDAGIDFLTPFPIENAFKNYKKNIHRAEEELCWGLR